MLDGALVAFDEQGAPHWPPLCDSVLHRNRSIPVTFEMFPVREASRVLGQQIDRLERGDVDKVAIMNRSRMAAVLVFVEEYARLIRGARNPSRAPSAA